MQEKAVLFALLLVAPLVAGCVNPFAPKPTNWDVQVKLTVITSPRAVAGAEDVTLAVDLATRTFNASGAGVTYRIINDPMPDGIAKAMDRLVKGKPTAFIAALAPEEAQAALDKAAAAKIPLVLVSPTNATPTGAGTAYLVQAAADPAFAGRALAALASEGRTPKTAVFTDDDPYTARAFNAFKAAAGATLVREVHVTAPSAAGGLAREACDAGADTVVLLVTPTEAAALVTGLQTAGCRERVEILAAPWVRQNELIEGTGDRDDGRAFAEGIRGVTPAGTEPGVFRGAFEAVYGRGPSRLAAPAHDAVAYATLAAFTAKGGVGKDPFQGAVSGADVQKPIFAVASSPGVKMSDFALAATAAKSGDDVDWIGFEQDFDYEPTHVPKAGPFDVWRVSASGGFDTTGTTVG